MKRKIYGLILLLALVFSVGCNKEKEQPAPTPTATVTPTSTPTPTPANLAKTNIDKLPELFDNLMSYQPQNTIDYTNGVGYDVTLEFSLGQQIAELLELTDLESISIAGTMDVKDTLAANFDLCINDDKIMNAHLFADSANLLFNLPAYSANYAATTWEELLSAVTEEEVDFDGTSSLTGSGIIRTINTVDKNALPSNEEVTKLIRKHLEDFAACFLPVDGITENASIGTGDYLLAGKKYTVRADINDVYAIMESLETELQNYGEVDFGLEDLKTEGATALLLDYYVSENGDYAWAAYSDNATGEPVVFINTALGFCLYGINEDDTTEVFLCSEKTTEKSGTIIIPSPEEDEEAETDAMGTIDYEYTDTSFTMQAMIDTIVLTLEASKVNDTIRYDITMIVDGLSIVIVETVAPTYVDMSCSLASYGMEYLTTSVKTDIRDYVEIPVPQNTTTMDAWTEELDQETLLADLVQVLQKYPTLLALFTGSGEEPSEDEFSGSSEGSYETSKDYTDEFKSMTGYTVDDTGYVDFYPLESEVLAIGKPSTGFDTMQITEDQKNALMDYAKNNISNCEASSDTYYNVWGSVEFRDVQSYYTRDYYFTDSSNWDNSITFTFDAVSGGLASVDIYHEDKDTALGMANEILALLGVDYTVTAEIVEDYTFAKNFSFSGYDASEYGDNYYNVSFSVYYPEW